MTTTPGYTVEALLQAIEESKPYLYKHVLARAAELTQVTAQSVERAVTNPLPADPLPCPFCGEEVTVEQCPPNDQVTPFWWYISCGSDCPMLTERLFLSRNKDRVVSQWNTRRTAERASPAKDANPANLSRESRRILNDEPLASQMRPQSVDLYKARCMALEVDNALLQDLLQAQQREIDGLRADLEHDRRQWNLSVADAVTERELADQLAEALNTLYANDRHSVANSLDELMDAETALKAHAEANK